MIDVVGDADVLEVPVLLPPLAEVDVEVVECDGRVRPAGPPHHRGVPAVLPLHVQPAEEIQKQFERNTIHEI